MNGSTVNPIHPQCILVVKNALSSEPDGVAGARVDYFETVFAGEFFGLEWRSQFFEMSPEQYLNSLYPKAFHLVELQATDGTPIWVNIKECRGPYDISRIERHRGANSAVQLQGRKLLLANEPREIESILQRAGIRKTPRWLMRWSAAFEWA